MSELLLTATSFRLILKVISHAPDNHFSIVWSDSVQVLFPHVISWVSEERELI